MNIIHNKYGLLEVVSEDNTFYTVKPNKNLIIPFGKYANVFKDECRVVKEYKYRTKK